MDLPICNDEVIRKRDTPLIDDGGIRVLRGNVAPRDHSWSREWYR